MIREADFGKRAQFVTTMENLSKSFSKLNASEHPAIKAKIIARDKEIEEEMKESEDSEEGQQYFDNNVPDEALKEEVSGEHKRGFAEQLEDSAWEYFSKNLMSDIKEGEDLANSNDIGVDADADADDWFDHVNKKDEL